MAEALYIETPAGNLYFSPTTQQYTGSGTPWTAAATSPFRIANNQVTGGPWTPTVAPTSAIYTGERLAGTYRDRVVETIPINIYANTPDRAVELVVLLRQRANWANYSQPALLAIQPNTTTNTAYFEIYKADIQEDPLFLMTEYRQGHIRVTMQIERSALAGAYRAGTSMTFTNSGGTVTSINSSSIDSTDIPRFPTSLNGDVEEEGLPLNLTLSSFSVKTMTKLWLGTIVAKATDATNAGTYSTSNTTTGVICSSSTSTTTLALDTLLGDRRLSPRVMCRFSAVASNAEVRMGISFGSTTPMFYTPWIDPPDVATIVDFGTFPIDRIIALDLATIATVFIYVRSTNGSSASVTLARNITFLYRQFCAIDTAFTSAINNYVVRAFKTASSGNRAALPRPQMAAQRDSTPNIISADAIRGDVPRAYTYDTTLHQLFVAWLGTGGLWTTGETLTFAGEYAPLYRSFRGAS